METELWDYEFDTVDQLYIVEKWWFGKTKQERYKAFEEIKKHAKRALDFFRAASGIFAKTIGSDLIPVHTMEEPKATIAWMDAPFKTEDSYMGYTKGFKVKSYI